MSVSEREAALERWIEAGKDRVQVIAHIGAESIADVLELARHAEVAGAVGKKGSEISTSASTCETRYPTCSVGHVRPDFQPPCRRGAGGRASRAGGSRGAQDAAVLLPHSREDRSA